MREIGTLWIGGPMSWMERLCLRSYVDRGQGITLFSYGDVPNIPDGVTVVDGREILDTDNFLKYEKKDSYALFADLFRLHMMRARPGMIWVDTDVYCVRPLETPGDYIFGREKYGSDRINNAVIGIGLETPLLQALLDFTSDPFAIPDFLPKKDRAELQRAKANGTPIHVSQQQWGVWGPTMVTHYVEKLGLLDHAQPIDCFYPVTFAERLKFLKEAEQVESQITANTTLMHVWASNKRELNIRSAGVPEPGSWFDMALKRHGMRASDAPLSGRGWRVFDGKGGYQTPEGVSVTPVPGKKPATPPQVPAPPQPQPVAAAAPKPAAPKPAAPAVPAFAPVVVAPHVAAAAAEAMADLSPEMAALLTSLGPAPVARVADLTGAGAELALALHRRDGAEVLLVDMAHEGGFAKSNWPEACAEWLIRHGVAFGAIRIARSLRDLGPADLVVNIGGFGDVHKVKHLAAVLPALMPPGGRMISDIRKGSGGWGFFKDYGEVAEVSKTKGEVVIARTVLTVSRKLGPGGAADADEDGDETAGTSTRDGVAEGEWAAIARVLMGPDGFYTDNGNHSFLYVPRSADTLVVTFDNLDIAMEKREDRRPWGYSFIEKNGWSMLGVMAGGWTWYRDPWVAAEFDRLAAEGFFARFKRVVFYGASMGGYAAAAFSAACPGADVVAISPQSTLDKNIVPWETRYKVAWGRDFSGKYGDASLASQAAGKMVLLYDPYEKLDAGHADRFTGANVVKLRAPLLGHRLGSSLQQMGILGPITTGALNGTLTEAEFYRMIRARKSFGRYQKELFKRAVKMGRLGLARKLGRFVLTRGDHRWIRQEMARL